MKTTFLVSPFFALLISSASAQIQHFGYFHIQTSPAGQYQSSEATIIQVDAAAYSDITSLGGQVPSIKSFVSNIFHAYLAPTSGCSGLRPNLANFNQWASDMQGVIQHVGAFYLVDEPYHNYGPAGRECSYADVSAMLSLAAVALKNKFPNTPIAIVETTKFTDSTFPAMFPAEIDWIGFNCYPNDPSPTALCGSGMTMSQLLVQLNAKLSSSQRVIVVPQAFDVATYPLGGAALQELASYALRMALAEPKTVAVMAFLGNKEEVSTIRSVREPASFGVCGALPAGTPAELQAQAQCYARFSARQAVRRTYESFVAGLRSSGLTNISLGRPIVSRGQESPGYVEAATFAVDGFDETRAYPGNTSFKYEIALGSNMSINDADIYLSWFGFHPYINTWKLTGTSSWGVRVDLAGETDSPNSNFLRRLMTDACGRPPKAVRYVTLEASSSAWIGVHEIRLKGAPTSPSGNLAYRSVVRQLEPLAQPGSELYAHSACDLTDGSTGMFAYPGHNQFKYEIVLGSNEVGVTRIDLDFGPWGYATPTQYVTSWRVKRVDANGNAWDFACNGNPAPCVGGTPNQDVVILNTAISAARIQVQASSPNAWIGMREV